MAIPHPRDIQLAVVNWLDDRYPFTKAVDEALYQRVPNFANAFYYCFGGMVFILIAFQLLTGVLLALYYVPDAAGNPAPAYTSVQFIQNSVYLGWLIRGVHFWSAILLIIMVLLHMARVYWTGSYRAPRELNWIVGVLMLLLVLVLSLTGYLLPWDTKAYFATEVTIKIAGLTPPQQVGMFLKELLQGGPVVGPPTLQRFFTLHVFRLPAAVVQKNLQLEPSADPRAVTITRPDWYFLFLFQFLKLGPELVMSQVIPGIVVGALVLFPFIDAIAGPRLARRLGWERWPVPGRTIITGTVFVLGLLYVAFLEFWALAGPQFCLPYLTGPICGA